MMLRFYRLQPRRKRSPGVTVRCTASATRAAHPRSRQFYPRGIWWETKVNTGSPVAQYAHAVGGFPRIGQLTREISTTCSPMCEVTSRAPIEANVVNLFRTATGPQLALNRDV